jgi:DNA gyrase subunit A
VIAYIEALEQELAALREAAEGTPDQDEDFEPSEPPTTIQVVSISRSGMAKRTPRHLYSRQRRGGMGVFDLDAPEGDPPAHLVLADATAWLTLVTDQGRAFRVPLEDLPESPVRARGKSLLERFTARPGEKIALIFADPLTAARSAYLALVTQRGQLRRIAAQYLGRNLQPGALIHNVAEGGPPAAACWTSGSDDLFMVTRCGQAIRFSERLAPVRGCLGIRVEPGDAVCGIATIAPDGGVFLLSAEGKGTIRLAAGFSANKAPGASGKVAMKADHVVGAVAAGDGDDLFAISQLGKIIRFRAGDVPAKEGVVQGVICMNLRADQCTAVAASPAGT